MTEFKNVCQFTEFLFDGTLYVRDVLVWFCFSQNLSYLQKGVYPGILIKVYKSLYVLIRN